MAIRSWRPAPAAGLMVLWLVAGFGAVVAGWDLSNHFGKASVEQLVFGAGPGSERPVSGPEWTAILIFTPAECPGLMTVVDRLNQLGSGKLRVRGLLMVDPARFPDWRDLLAANEIDFPVQQVNPANGRHALEDIGDMGSPVLALFDRTHQLRLTSDLTDQAELVNLIQSSVDRDSRR